MTLSRDQGPPGARRGDRDASSRAPVYEVPTATPTVTPTATATPVSTRRRPTPRVRAAEGARRFKSGKGPRTLQGDRVNEAGAGLRAARSSAARQAAAARLRRRQGALHEDEVRRAPAVLLGRTSAVSYLLPGGCKGKYCSTSSHRPAGNRRRRARPQQGGVPRPMRRARARAGPVAAAPAPAPSLMVVGRRRDLPGRRGAASRARKVAGCRVGRPDGAGGAGAHAADAELRDYGSCSRPATPGSTSRRLRRARARRGRLGLQARQRDAVAGRGGCVRGVQVGAAGAVVLVSERLGRLPADAAVKPRRRGRRPAVAARARARLRRQRRGRAGRGRDGDAGLGDAAVGAATASRR